MRRLVFAALLLGACADQTRPADAPNEPPAATRPRPPALPGERSAWVGDVSAGCRPDALEVLVPFYEGLRFAPAAAALTAAKVGHMQLAYPGALSMPLVAWRCGQAEWHGVVVGNAGITPAELTLHTRGDAVSARLECFGRCELREVRAEGDWRALASRAAREMGMAEVPRQPRLDQRHQRMRFFVRNWVDGNAGEPAAAARVDWPAAALRAQLAREPAGTVAFVFGLDPNEVDLRGEYFWAPGALDEASAMVRANPAVAHLHWLNLRTWKTAIPRLGIRHEPPEDVLAAARRYPDGIRKIAQYVFEAIEMCPAAQAWQESRVAQMRKLLGLGFRVIALDEFPTAPSWSAEPCRAGNHLHRPGDYADEVRLTMELVKKLAEMARLQGAVLTSEEPSAMLLSYTSGYMDGAFNEPAEMYEMFSPAAGVERVPLFSTVFAGAFTPYTRVSTAPGHVPQPPRGWWVQEKVPGAPVAPAR